MSHAHRTSDVALRAATLAEDRTAELVSVQGRANEVISEMQLREQRLRAQASSAVLEARKTADEIAQQATKEMENANQRFTQAEGQQQHIILEARAAIAQRDQHIAAQEEALRLRV